MKYLPLIDLHSPGVEAAIRLGRLRLQVGQWVRCGKEGNPSRFVGVVPGSLWVAHCDGGLGSGSTKRTFPRLVEVWRKRNTRNK